MEYRNIVKHSINEFIEFFFEHPNYYLTESDIHSYLFRIIYEKLEEKKLLVNKKDIMLLHREYPTYQKYKKYNNKKLFAVNKGNKGHFDLAILNENAEDLFSEEQEIEIAIEVKMNEKSPIYGIKRSIQNDLEKLKNSKNKVKQGYFLFFIRHTSYDDKKFKINKRNGSRLLGKGKKGDKKTMMIIDYLKKEAGNVNKYYIEYDYEWSDDLKNRYMKNQEENSRYTFKKDGKLQIYKNAQSNNRNLPKQV